MPGFPRAPQDVFVIPMQHSATCVHCVALLGALERGDAIFFKEGDLGRSSEVVFETAVDFDDVLCYG